MSESIKTSIIASVITSIIIAVLAFLSSTSASLINEGWLIKILGGATAKEVADLKKQLESAQQKISAISYEENIKENNYSTVIKAGTGYKFKIQSDGNIALYRGESKEAFWHAMQGCPCK